MFVFQKILIMIIVNETLHGCILTGPYVWAAHKLLILIMHNNIIRECAITDMQYKLYTVSVWIGVISASCSIRLQHANSHSVGLYN